MTVPHGDASQAPQSAASSPGNARIRLHQSLDQPGEDDGADAVDELLIAWQSRWSDQRDATARKLAAIEAHLQKLATREQSKLRLSIVGTPPNADQITAMGPF